MGKYTANQLAFGLAILLGGSPAWAAEGTSWPTIHRDNQRSGCTDEMIRSPYERKWFRDLHDEMIATRVEGIVAEGRCFVGTFAGNLHAVNVTDGTTAWTFKATGAIGASACCVNGRVFIGSDDGSLYCISAADGKEIWRYPAGAGIWVAPASDGKAIYFGDRAGVFHAVSAADGKARWTFRTGGMILTPASITTDSAKIVFGSEDMHVYCLSPEGKPLWKSEKLGGLSMRDHAPTIWQGLAIVTTNPPIGFHHAAGESPAILTKAQKDLPVEPDDQVVFDKWGCYTMKLTLRRLDAERKAVLKYLNDRPEEQTFHALDLESGKKPWIAPVLYTAGLHNPPTPPTFNPKTGHLYVWAPSSLSNYGAGVPGGAIAVGKLDRKTGLVDLIWHKNGDKLGWAFDFVAPADETQSLSLMGDVLLNTHQGIIGGMDLASTKFIHVYIARDTYGGIFGPALVQGSFQGADKAHAQGRLALMCNEWHGPDRSIVSIADNRLFWVVGSQVVCLGGPDTPKTDTGGTKAPLPIQRKTTPLVPGGNVAAGQIGKFNASIPNPRITQEQLRKYLDAPAPTSKAAGDGVLQSRLDASVTELISADWAPLVIELGISGEERYFWRTSETMQTIALAIPHLSPEVRAKAKARLAVMLDRGCPLRVAVQNQQEPRREPYELGVEMKRYAAAIPRYAANVEDIYALWAAAHYADAWDKVLPQLPEMLKIFDAFAAKPPAFDHNDKDNDASEHLNGQIAGVLGYARIMAKAGKPDQAERAMNILAELVSFRVHHELADTVFVRPTKTSAYKLHCAKIPRYVGLTPEVTQMLHDFAGKKLEENIRGLSHDLPVWHHAFGERLIGGENYISPPTLARGLFAAMADGVQASPDELITRLDQPWCKGDLNYIEKLTAILLRTAIQPSPNPR